MTIRVRGDPSQTRRRGCRPDRTRRGRSRDPGSGDLGGAEAPVGPRQRFEDRFRGYGQDNHEKGFRMADRPIDLYLNDHMAGAMLGAELAGQIANRSEGTPLGGLITPVDRGSDVRSSRWTHGAARCRAQYRQTSRGLADGEVESDQIQRLGIRRARSGQLHGASDYGHLEFSGSDRSGWPSGRSRGSTRQSRISISKN